MAMNQVALSDRLGAALEGIVIGDRWSTAQGAEVGHPIWQKGFLQVAESAASAKLVPLAWRSHFQSLTSPAAVLINALPYLWLEADAQGHHRATVARGVASWGLPEAEAIACETLFTIICQTMGHGPACSPWQRWQSLPSTALTPLLGQAVAIVAQSQGQLTVALGVAQHRGWRGAAVGLVGLLVGLSGGRSSLGFKARQRWLSPPLAPLADPWQGLSDERLAAIAAALYRRWAGGRTNAFTPLAVRV